MLFQDTIDKTCCFSGHRYLSPKQMLSLSQKVTIQIEQLIEQGYTRFITGGAIGFDMLAAQMVILQKIKNLALYFELALPFDGYAGCWNKQEQLKLNPLYKWADHIEYVAKKDDKKAYQKQGRYKVAHSSICICACQNYMSGETVEYAMKKKRKIINLLARHD